MRLFHDAVNSVLLGDSSAWASCDRLMSAFGLSPFESAPSEHFKKSHKPYFRCLEALEAAQLSQKCGSSRATTRVKQAEHKLEEAKKKLEAGIYGSELLDGIRGAKPGEHPIFVCGDAGSYNTCSNLRHRPVQMLNAKGTVAA